MNVHDIGAVRSSDQHVEFKRYVQDICEVGQAFHCLKTPKEEPKTQSEKLTHINKAVVSDTIFPLSKALLECLNEEDGIQWQILLPTGWTQTGEKSQAETSKPVCSPIPKKLQGHKGEYQHTEHEQEEDVEDIRQSIPDASESSSDLWRQNLISFTRNRLTFCKNKNQAFVLS